MEDNIVAIPRAQYQLWCRQMYNQQRSLPAITTSSSSTNAETTSTSDFRSVWCLPPELLLEVLGYLTSHQSSLYCVALVCRQWLFCATPILYKHPKIYNTYRWATFLLTLGRDKRLFHYGSLVHSIDLSCRTKTNSTPDKSVKKVTFQDSAQDTGMDTTNTDSSSSAQPLVITSSTASQGSATTITTTTTTITMNNEDNEDYDNDGDNDNPDADNVAVDDANTNSAEGGPNELADLLSEEEYYMSYHASPSLVVSTSSLIQLAQACPNLASIDLSFTNMFSDSMVEETGEYISTLQHYAIPPGLTHVKVSVEKAITAIGQHCPLLQQLKIQCCGWVSARVIWLWTVSCPNLTYLDVRRASKCSVKRLTSKILQVQQQQPQPHASYQQNTQSRQQQQQNSASLSPSSSSSSLPPSSSSSQAPLSRRSSSSLSSSSSNSSSSNSLASGSTHNTILRHWNTGESSNHAFTSASGSASTSAFASSSSSSTQPSGSLQRHSAQSSSTTPVDTTEEEPAGGSMEHGEQLQRRRQQQQQQQFPQNHPLHRFRFRHGFLPTNVGRIFMTIYMNEEYMQVDPETGHYDFWAMDGEQFEDEFRPQHTRLGTTTTTTAPNATNATNAPLAPALNADHLATASTLRSRAYRDFVASTSSNHSNTVYITDQTMREYVWSVLKEGKEQGMVELEWLQD